LTLGKRTAATVVWAAKRKLGMHENEEEKDEKTNIIEQNAVVSYLFFCYWEFRWSEVRQESQKL